MKPLLAVPAALVLSSIASAQLVVPISQSRSVWGDASVDGPPGQTSDSDLASAPDFGPFMESASVTLNDGSALGSSGGSQTSEILATSVVASGSAFANAEAYASGWSSEAFGASEVVFEFRLTAKAAYTCTGEISAFDNGATTIWLSQGATLIDYENACGPFASMRVDLAGTLDPGEYRFRIQSGGETYGIPSFFDYGSADFNIAFELTALSESYCTTSPNSAGAGATIGFSGSQDIAANDFTMEATGAVPNDFGLFFYGPDQTQVPFGDGFLCVGGNEVFRLNPPVQSDGAGNVSRLVDFASAPANGGPGAITADSTWNFQYWYRDPSGPGGTGFNLSDGLAVTFCP